jgi:hypothetical protein
MNPNQLVFSGAILLGLTALFRLVSGYRKHGFCCRFLALYFLIFTLFSINNLLLESGRIHSWPVFWGLMLPMNLVPAAFIYLYVRSISTGKDFSLKADWIHFLPALLTYANLLPYFMAGNAEKISLTNAFLSGNQDALETQLSLFGWSYYQPCLILLGLIYLLLILAKLAQYKLEVDKKQSRESKTLFHWLVFFAGVYILFWMGNSIFFISISFPDQPFFVQLRNIGTSFTLILTVLAFFFNTRPQFLKKLRGGSIPT